MRSHVNLMSDEAQFRVALRISARYWTIAWALLVMALIPMAGVRWQQRRDVRQRHEALEARYQPIQRTSSENRQLRTAAEKLVREQRIPLELSRDRAIATLLAVTSRAVEKTGGELYVRQITLANHVPGGQTGAGRGRMIIDAAGTLTYDVSALVDALDQAPLVDVKVISTEVVTDQDVEQKHYNIECSY